VDNVETDDSALIAACEGAACESIATNLGSGVVPGLEVIGNQLYWLRSSVDEADPYAGELVTCRVTGNGCAAPEVVAAFDGIPVELTHTGTDILFSVKGPYDRPSNVAVHRYDTVNGTTSKVADVGQASATMAASGDRVIVLAGRDQHSFVLGDVLYECKLDGSGCEILLANAGGAELYGVTSTEIRFASASRMVVWSRSNRSAVSQTWEPRDTAGTSDGERFYSAEVVSGETYRTAIRAPHGHLADVDGSVSGGETRGMRAAGRHLFVATKGEGDVLYNSQGFVYRISKTQGSVRTVATRQFPTAVAVGGSYVYWMHVENGWRHNAPQHAVIRRARR
jgi:hypothetical protein